MPLSPIIGLQRLPLAALVALSIPSLAHAQDIDAAPLSAVNLLARDIGSGTGATALEFQQDRGVWMGGYLANTKLAPSGSDDIETVVRGPVLGYGLGWHNLSVFIGYGQGESYLDDDGGKARIRSYFWGLSSYGTLPAPISDLTWGAALFTGGTHNKISSPTNSGGIAGLRWSIDWPVAGSGRIGLGSPDTSRHRHRFCGPGPCGASQPAKLRPRGCRYPRGRSHQPCNPPKSGNRSAIRYGRRAYQALYRVYVPERK